MKKIFTFIICVILCSGFISAQSFEYNWALNGGGENADRALTITSDNDQSIYIAGVFQNTATVEDITLNGAAKGSGANFDNNLFFFKLKNDKSIDWTVYSNDGVVNPTSITSCSDGGVILVGNIRAIVGGTTTSATIIDSENNQIIFSNLPTSINGFILKLDANGNTVWHKEITSTEGTNDILSVETDDDNNIYVVGNFSKNVTLPGSSLITATSTQSSYIAKLNGSTGDQIWIKTTSGGMKKEDFSKLTFDGTSLYVAGTLTNNTTPATTTIGGISLEPSNYPDIFYAKLDKDGNFSYAKLISHTSTSITGNTFVRSMEESNGVLYIGGAFKGEFIFGESSIISSTNLNGYLITLDANTGDNKWQRTVSSTTLNDVSSVLLKDNKLVTYGYFYNKTGSATDDIHFGNDIKLNTGTTNASGDLFVAIYDLNGIIKKADVLVQGPSIETSIAGATSIGNDFYFFASFNSTSLSLLATDNTLSTNGGYDFLLTKYSINGESSIENISSGDNFTLYVSNNTLIINNDQPQAIYIYNIAGQLISEQFIDSGTTSISLSKGIYIVKSKTKTTKVIL